MSKLSGVVCPLQSGLDWKQIPPKKVITISYPHNLISDGEAVTRLLGSGWHFLKTFFVRSIKIEIRKTEVYTHIEPNLECRVHLFSSLPWFINYSIFKFWKVFKIWLLFVCYLYLYCCLLQLLLMVAQKPLTTTAYCWPFETIQDLHLQFVSSVGLNCKYRLLHGENPTHICN